MATCVFLPTYSQRKAAALLVGMWQVCRFELGTVLLNGVDVAGASVPLPGQAYAVDIWYEFPALHPEGSAECSEPTLSVLLLSTESGSGGNWVRFIQVVLRTMKVLVDTGASDDFISSAEVNALGLSPQSSEWSQLPSRMGVSNPYWAGSPFTCV
ncbi:hypothetical protein Vretimale_3287 [Volvox reticuliferus]|uniref:Uncharacterized protein n=1 Tax=Volvox reticuliferus TaxID=1737510 RepID=A0A8J4D6D5_9CHLO|nr:hypothetical protein Vretifemale_20939 [Volvox reticuliferus]GIL97712.1 hypothetical protein Vretimale_3287 [Volvox reticuliferus]